MRPGLALDVAVAIEFLQRAYDDEEAGRDPRPNFARPQSAIAPVDILEALGLAVDALARATAGDPDLLARSLWLDGELAADADAFAAGASEQRP